MYALRQIFSTISTHTYKHSCNDTHMHDLIFYLFPFFYQVDPPLKYHAIYGCSVMNKFIDNHFQDGYFYLLSCRKWFSGFY